MFTLIEKSLTPDLITTLPAGAHKLLNAARLEPRATNRRYQELTGYQERSIRSFITVLVDVGLAERVQYQPVKMKAKNFADLSPAQQVNFERLCTIGVTDVAANRFVRIHSAEMIEASLFYIKKVQAVKPAAYLVWCLENPQIWFEPHYQKAEPDRIERTGSLFTLEPFVENLSTRLAAQPSLTMTVEGITISDNNWEVILLAYAVEAATGVDIRLSEETQKTVQDLYRAGYAAEEVAIFVDEIFPDQDWRGRKGEKPTLELLRQGIASTKHRFAPTHSASLDTGLLKQVQAIRAYFPDGQLIHCLADLWSNEARQALDRVKQEETHCPKCGHFWSMCRCGQPEPLPIYKGGDARMWTALIDQLSIQLNQATFDCWVKHLRLVGFELGDACDIYTAAASAVYVKDWLEQHLQVAMVQTLSKMHGKPVQIEFVVDAR